MKKDKLEFYDKWLLDIICEYAEILKPEFRERLSEIRDLLIDYAKELLERGS